MSWSRNWPKNVVPAVWLGLFGLFALSDRSTISAFGPAASGSFASSSPPGSPSSRSAASTFALWLGERRQPEDPPEMIGAHGRVTRGRRGAAGRRDRARRIEGDRPGAGAHRTQEPLPAEPTPVSAHG